MLSYVFIDILIAGWSAEGVVHTGSIQPQACLFQQQQQ